MPEDHSNRDRIRALVRDVLDKIPAENLNPGPDEQPLAVAATATRFIDTAPSQAPDTTSITRDESAKKIITEDDVRGMDHGAVLRIAEGARLTPLAADIVREKQIEIVRRGARRSHGATKLIAIGADHGGFKMKQELKAVLTEWGHRVHDFGTDSEDAVDYPDFAYAVARAVADGTAELGIMIDGAGVGSAMTANKVPGVRAAACYSVDLARNSREHNDANVLTLGSKTVTTPQMLEIVRAWLATEIKEDRHKKRVAKIEAIGRQYQR